ADMGRLNWFDPVDPCRLIWVLRSKATLMDHLAKFAGEIYFADSMQPIEMREQIPGLWLPPGGLSKPGEHDRAQIFTRQQQSIQFGTAVPLERLSHVSQPRGGGQ